MPGAKCAAPVDRDGFARPELAELGMLATFDDAEAALHPVILL